METDEPGDLDITAGIAAGHLDCPGYLGFTVDHEGLFEQADFFKVFAHATVDHLLDDFLRLAGLAGLFGQHFTLAFDRGLIDLILRHPLRVGGGDVHRQLFAEFSQFRFIPARFKADQHADLAHIGRRRTVHVGRYYA